MIYRQASPAVQGLFSDQKDTHAFLPVPMVYETVAAEPLRWEYRVLTIDLREMNAPDESELNELGKQGWLLVSVLATGNNTIVNYYFARQQQA